MCAEFVALCRQLGLFAEACVAIDGSKFKAVNRRVSIGSSNLLCMGLFTFFLQRPPVL